MKKFRFNNFLAIGLPLTWFIYSFAISWEYSWILKSICGGFIGASFPYLWSHYEYRDRLVEYLKGKTND